MKYETYGICGIYIKEFVSNGYITLEDGGKIQDSMDGFSCSHNNFKMLCRKCQEHIAKDLPLRQAFYELNEKYLVSLQ